MSVGCIVFQPGHPFVVGVAGLFVFFGVGGVWVSFGVGGFW